MLLSLAQAGTPAANLLFYPSTPKAREGGAMRYLYLHKGNFLPHVWARYGAVLLAPEPNSRELQYAPGSPDVPVRSESSSSSFCTQGTVGIWVKRSRAGEN